MCQLSLFPGGEVTDGKLSLPPLGQVFTTSIPSACWEDEGWALVCLWFLRFPLHWMGHLRRSFWLWPHSRKQLMSKHLHVPWVLKTPIGNKMQNTSIIQTCDLLETSRKKNRCHAQRIYEFEEIESKTSSSTGRARGFSYLGGQFIDCS